VVSLKKEFLQNFGIHPDPDRQSISGLWIPSALVELVSDCWCHPASMCLCWDSLHYW